MRFWYPIYIYMSKWNDGRDDVTAVEHVRMRERCYLLETISGNFFIIIIVIIVTVITCITTIRINNCISRRQCFDKRAQRCCYSACALFPYTQHLVTDDKGSSREKRCAWPHSAFVWRCRPIRGDSDGMRVARWLLVPDTMSCNWGTELWVRTPGFRSARSVWGCVRVAWGPRASVCSAIATQWVTTAARAPSRWCWCPNSDIRILWMNIWSYDHWLLSYVSYLRLNIENVLWKIQLKLLHVWFDEHNNNALSILIN